MDREDLKKAMLQAQDMQLNLLKAQEELAKLEIVGHDKAKLLGVIMNAQGDIKSVKVHPNLLKQDTTQVEQAIFDAFKDATTQAADITKEKLSSFSAQLGLEQ